MTKWLFGKQTNVVIGMFHQLNEQSFASYNTHSSASMQVILIYAK